MRVACLSVNFDRCWRASASQATKQTARDISKFCLDMGFQVFYIDKCRPANLIKTYLLSLSRLISTFDYLVVPYPLFGNPLLRSAFFEHLFSSFLGSVVRIILYVYDIPLDQLLLMEETPVVEEVLLLDDILFKKSHKILCFNHLMKELIRSRYNLPDDKFLLFELLDYGSDVQPALNLDRYNDTREVRVVYVAGSYLHRKTKDAVLNFIQRVPHAERIRYVFIGPQGWFLRDCGRYDVRYEREITGSKYVEFLLNMHFGLILKVSSYNEYGSTSKFSSYMIVGLPVLVPKDYKYLSQIVDKYKVGIVYETPSEIPGLIENYSPERVKEMSLNAYKLGLKLHRGIFFKRAVISALKMSP